MVGQPAGTPVVPRPIACIFKAMASWQGGEKSAGLKELFEAKTLTG